MEFSYCISLFQIEIHILDKQLCIKVDKIPQIVELLILYQNKKISLKRFEIINDKFTSKVTDNLVTLLSLT